MGGISPQLFEHIANHFDLPFNAKVEMIDLEHMRDLVVPLFDEPPVRFDSEPISPYVNFRTIHIELIRFGSNFGEDIKAGYAPETRTLYIDILQPFHMPVQIQRYEPIPQPPRPLVWHKNPNESIWIYGERMFKTRGNVAYIDNPRKRAEYQKTVLKSIILFIKRG